MADKKGRVKEIIQRNLSEIIIHDLKAPIAQFASINEVEVTDDYSFCKVYCSHVQESKCDELVRFLNNNAKKIRMMLSKKISIFKTPELRFIRDTSYEKGKAMEDLIYQAIHNKPKTLKDIEKEEKAKATKKSTVKKTTTKKTSTKKTVAKKPSTRNSASKKEVGLEKKTADKPKKTRTKKTVQKTA